MKSLFIIIFISLCCNIIYSFTQKENDLIMAAEKSDIMSIRNILNKKDVNINVQDRYGVTPLMHAVFNKDIYILELLLKNNANPNMQNVTYLIKIFIY